MNNFYYGNTVLEWIIAGGLILFSLILGKAVYWLFKNIATPWLQRTGRVFICIVIDMIEEPIVMVIVILGIRTSLKTLKLTDTALQNLNYAVSFIFTVTIIWLITRLYNAIHERYFVALAAKTETTLDDHLLPLFKKGFNGFIWILGIIVALNNAGFNIAPILAGLGIGGLGLALAFQHTFSNILSGFLVYTNNHLKMGDRIKVRGHWEEIDGDITKIGLRNTTIKTRYEGREVSIPNTFLTDRDVVNVGSESGRQLFMVYKLSQDTTPQKVRIFMTLLEDAVNTTAGTQETVHTALLSVNEIGLDIMLLYWIDSSSPKLKVRSEINFKILEGMESEGIQFSSRATMYYQKDAPY